VCVCVCSLMKLSVSIAIFNSWISLKLTRGSELGNHLTGVSISFFWLQASIEDNMDPQRENKRLKLEMDLLIKKINNDDYLNLLQLREKNMKLEQEKNVLQLIIDALCAKINKDSDLEPKQAS